EELGGSTAALEFIQREIEESAASYHERYRTGQDVVVGANKYVTDTVDDVEILRIDPESERRQLERLERFKADRDQAEVERRLAEVTDREPERILAWRATEFAGERAQIEIELAAGGGFGTAVRITAEHSRPDLDGALEQVLDELGGAERRPFSST